MAEDWQRVMGQGEKCARCHHGWNNHKAPESFFGGVMPCKECECQDLRFA